MDALISSHAIESIREVWWDIRPHPNFGTVELRICDGMPTLDEIGCIAALAQCLVERFDRQLDDGYTLPEPRPWLVRENKWRAARYGLDAEIVIDNSGKVQPVKDAIINLVDDLLPLGAAARLCRGARVDSAADRARGELSTSACRRGRERWRARARRRLAARRDARRAGAVSRRASTSSRCGAICTPILSSRSPSTARPR